MNWHRKISLFFIRLWISVKSFPGKAWCIVWHQKILVWRDKSYIPENEFDPSLELDERAMRYMSEEELARYRKNTMWRRYIAHQREMER